MTARKTDKVAYRLNEAAVACGLSAKTLKRAIHGGQLAAKKLGDGPRAAYLIEAEALRNWISGLNDAA